MIDIGRLSSISTPIVVGYALMVSAPRTLYFYSAAFLLSGPMLIGALTPYALRRHVRGEVAADSETAQTNVNNIRASSHQWRGRPDTTSDKDQ